MLARDTKIYKDAYSMTKEVFDITKKMKTEYRSSVARRIEELSIALAMKVVEANLFAPTSEERQLILGHDFIVIQEQLFFMLSLAFDLKLLNYKQHATLLRYLDNIGKQVTGWRKSTSR